MKKYHITFRNYEWLAYSIFIKAKDEKSAMREAFVRFDKMYLNSLSRLSDECDVWCKCL